MQFLKRGCPRKTVIIIIKYQIFIQFLEEIDMGMSVVVGSPFWVSNLFVARRRNDLERADLEGIWLEIRSANNVFLLGTIYRPPNSRVEFWDKFQEMLDNVKMDTIKQIVIMGDFNAHEHTASGVKLDILNGINHLTSHINEPTRITETTQTNLDKIITNIPHFVTNAEVIPRCWTMTTALWQYR